jgi:hypothetical protein
MHCRFGGLWYTKPDDAVEYAKFFSRSHDAVIRVYDAAGNVIQTHEHDALTGRSSRLLKTRALRTRTGRSFVKYATTVRDLVEMIEG